MTRFGMQLLSAPNAAVAPEIGTAFGAENTERVRKLHNHACQVALWVSGALIIGLVLFGLTGIAISVLAAEVIMAIYVVRGCLVLLDEPLARFGQTVVQPPPCSSDASCVRSNRGVVRRTKAANLGVL